MRVSGTPTDCGSCSIRVVVGISVPAHLEGDHCCNCWLGWKEDSQDLDRGAATRM